MNTNRSIRFLRVGLMATATMMVSGCGERGPVGLDPQMAPVLHEALSSDDPVIREVVRRADRHEIQVILEYPAGGGLDDGTGDWIREQWRVDPQAYFYPASTVKMPTAFVAVERVGRPDSALAEVARLVPLDLDTPFRVEDDTLITTVRREVEKVFAVSDNAAHNRLHELAGRDGVNTRMAELELLPFQLAHRLSTANSGSAEHRGIWFYADRETPSQGDSVYMRRPPAAPIDTLDAQEVAGLRKGRGYMAGGERIDEPFDFSAKNRAPLETLLETLKRAIRPELAGGDGAPVFGFTEPERAFLVQAMRNTPREAGYDTTYPDAFVKFLVFGDHEGAMPEQVHIANKVGMAYGTVTDVAWVRDEERGVEFLMAATLLVNEDGVFNDDLYEYEETAYPFLAALGRQVLERLAGGGSR